MPGGHLLAGDLAVPLLVIEKDVGTKGGEEVSLGKPAEEERLVDTNIPVTERADHTLVGRRATGGDKSGANRALVAALAALKLV